MALSQLAEEYDQNEMVRIAYHVGDLWSTPEISDRVYWYFTLPNDDYWMFPVTFFSGGTGYFNGAGDLYSEYSNIVEQQMQEETPVFMEITGLTDDTGGWISADITLFEDIAESDVYLRFVVTEDSLWESGYLFNSIARDILEEQELTISQAGETETFSASFSIDPTWNPDKINVIGFVQWDNFDEDFPILQAGKMLEGSATVYGNVTDFQTGDPIPARIASEGTFYETYAQSDGYYDLEINAGTHTLNAEYFGYYTETLADLVIEPFQEMELDIQLTPRPTTALSGTVVDFHGNPIPSAIVTLSETPIESVITNENGEFSFSDIPGDMDYVVEVSADEYEVTTEGIYLPAEGNSAQEFVLYGYVGFEISDGGFSGEGDWQWGVPQSDGNPDYAYEGGFVWATNLYGFYTTEQTQDMISPQYELIGTDDGDAYLTFYHYYDIREFLDGGNVSISTDNGESWELITPEAGYSHSAIVALDGDPGFTGLQQIWEQAVFDISDYIGNEVSFRFRFASQNNLYEQNGWYIDQFSIHGAWIGIASGVDDEETEIAVPRTSELMQNYPNPFNPITTIRYELAQADNVSLNVYDSTGRLIKTLVDEKQASGYYRVSWNGKNEAGREVPAGIYIYRLETTDGYEETRKMILLK